jgi:hypothetical protein
VPLELTSSRSPAMTTGDDLAPDHGGRDRAREQNTPWPGPLSDRFLYVISGCYHRINAETLMKRAVSAKAVSAKPSRRRRPGADAPHRAVGNEDSATTANGCGTATPVFGWTSPAG